MFISFLIDTSYVVRVRENAKPLPNNLLLTGAGDFVASTGEKNERSRRVCDPPNLPIAKVATSAP